MEIILSQKCKSLTGTVGSGFGYHIQKHTDLDGKTRFWGVRNSKGPIPPNGHWQFIVSCAELTKLGLHIADVKVTNRELFEALREANLPSPAFLNWNNVETYNAQGILNFKKIFGL